MIVELFLGAAAAAGAPPEQRPLLTVLPAALTETFDAFSERRRGVDAMPPPLAEAVTRGGPSKWYGANPALAKQSRKGLWLIPGTDALCIYRRVDREGGTVGCIGSLKQAAEGFVTIGGIAPKDVVIGVVPKGVTSVRLTLQSGKSRTVAVRRNVFSVPAKPKPLRVRFTTADGKPRVLSLKGS
jgi:hypothetical protein